MATTRSSIVYGDDKLSEPVKVITGATTLTSSDSGSICVLNAATGAAITLPAALSGFNLKVFVGAAFATSDWVLTAPTAIIYGGSIVNSVNVVCSAKANINLVSTAETIGDYIELYSDGSKYYVNGIGTLAGAITFT